MCKKLYALCLMYFHCIYGIEHPKLTIIIVLDQGAYHEIQRLLPGMSGGIKQLAEEGIFYLDAHYPHGAPVTAAGHASLATGSLPFYHGIINNRWYDRQGEIVRCHKNAIEKGPCHLSVDALSDQAIQLQKERFTIYSLSFKNRSAIMMAGHLATPIWFNKKYDTLKTLADRQLPDWAVQFNKLKHESFSPDKALPPYVNKVLFEAALYAIKDWHAHQKNDLILWMSVSALDKVGHRYGPFDNRKIDMYKEIDQELGSFFKSIDEVIPKHQRLTVLTADHGVAPLPETLEKMGYDSAQRLLKNKLLEAANDISADTFVAFRPPFLYDKKTSDLNKKVPAFLEKQFPNVINRSLFATALEEKKYPFGTPESFIYYQQYPQRSSDITILPHTYCLITEKEFGAKHNMPFNYNTQVPLIISWPGQFSPKRVSERIYLQQLSPTLAHLLEIPSPSAASFPLLPEIN
jgi:predicted AlkP superfamily pyrophosphatase or phosphodiesterase